MKRFGTAFILIFMSLGIVSCATYQTKVFEARKQLRGERFDEALVSLKKLSENVDRDQLVYLMDYAMALQIAGKYKESAEAFGRADKLVDLNDYHSITNVVGATLGGEEMVQYKGESYEKFLINTLNAINYLMMGDYDGGLVEARRINDKISKMKMDGRDPYEQSPFARYLAALMWESERKFDDAYLEYEGSYKIDKSNPFLPADLIRSSRLARRDETYKKWKSDFASVQENSQWYDKGMGELIVIYQQGWGPEKQVRSGQYRFPQLRPTPNQTQSAQIKISGFESISTFQVYDIAHVAIQTLEKDFGALIARRVGGVAVKAVVADQIRQKNELLGSLAWIAMNVADRADLRQWSTLPASIQIGRVFLKPGIYKIAMQGMDSGNNVTRDAMTEKEIKITAGRKTFINWRSLH